VGSSQAGKGLFFLYSLIFDGRKKMFTQFQFLFKENSTKIAVIFWMR